MPSCVSLSAESFAFTASSVYAMANADVTQTTLTDGAFFIMGKRGLYVNVLRKHCNVDGHEWIMVV